MEKYVIFRQYFPVILSRIRAELSNFATEFFYPRIMSKQKRFILQENEIPTQWYNIQAEMPNKPLPPLNPATKEPLTAEDLAHIFSYECSKQELDSEHAWIDIPEPVLDMYKYYRFTPGVRSYALYGALDSRTDI